MADRDLGSYAFGEFAANDEELARLEQQATAPWPLEKMILQAHGLQSGMQVLDLACGPGFITRRIAELVAPAPVLGADLNEQLLAVANQRNAEADNLSFEKANVYDLSSLNDRRFDFVYARLLFQHLERPAEALAQIREHLNPGGRLLIVDVDDAILDLRPPCRAFCAFTDLARTAQSRAGGDRWVGRKLPWLLKDAGYHQINTQIAVVDSEQLGMDAFVHITTGFKLEQLPESMKEQGRELLGRLREHLKQHNGAYAHAGVYHVSAVV